MALYMGLVEEKNRQAVVDALIREIKSRNNALTAGDIGYRYVLKALEQAGRSDVIFDMNYRDDVPGYGFQLKHGATALTESWQAYESVSNNHFMLGHLMEWFYAGLAGIKQTENSVAYKEIVIKPEVVGDLTNAKASFESPYGSIKSEWVKTISSFNLQVQIPANSTAMVYVPAKTGQTILLNGKKVPAVYAKGRAVVKIGSGNYQFSVANN
jgi:alpha-L-rhamnosidase